MIQLVCEREKRRCRIQSGGESILVFLFFNQNVLGRGGLFPLLVVQNAGTFLADTPGRQIISSSSYPAAVTYTAAHYIWILLFPSFVSKIKVIFKISFFHLVVVRKKNHSRTQFSEEKNKKNVCLGTCSRFT